MTGGVVSTTSGGLTAHVNSAVCSTLPARSVELMATACVTEDRPVYETGLVQAAAGFESSWQVDPTTLLPVPSTLNAILIEFEFVVPPEGTALLLPSVTATIVVIGGVVSVGGIVPVVPKVLMFISLMLTQLFPVLPFTVIMTYLAVTSAKL